MRCDFAVGFIMRYTYQHIENFMIKRITLSVSLVVYFVSIILMQTSVQMVYADEKPAPIDMEIDTVEYDLPYPGMLPDHPLYVLKSARDAVMVFLTRDYIKKSELMLLLSDKHVAMAMALAKNGEWSDAAELLQQSEDMFDEMLKTLDESTSQGVSPSHELMQQVLMSNEKHKEVIQQLLVTSPQGSRDQLEDVLQHNNQLNKQIKKAFDR